MTVILEQQRTDMNIALIDFGTGNLHSLIGALEHAGAAVRIEQDLGQALQADAVVLPCAGAFGAAAAQLSSGAAALERALAAGKPCLGICLGMQLLFETSEAGPGAGLNIVPGCVRRLRGRRVPHVGWNDVAVMDDPLFAGMSELLVYYANSYIVEPADESDVIAWTLYGDERFPAAVRAGSLYGVQFHPEKSGAAGLRLIGNFLAQAGS